MANVRWKGTVRCAPRYAVCYHLYLPQYHTWCGPDYATAACNYLIAILVEDKGENATVDIQEILISQPWR